MTRRYDGPESPRLGLRDGCDEPFCGSPRCRGYHARRYPRRMPLVCGLGGRPWNVGNLPRVVVGDFHDRAREHLRDPSPLP